MQFRLLVDFEVIEILEALPKKSRTHLLNHFQKIRAAPGDFSDYYERDVSGRAWKFQYLPISQFTIGSTTRINTSKFSR
jgi:hypothetical protein